VASCRDDSYFYSGYLEVDMPKLTDEVKIPVNINTDVSPAYQRTMLALLGNPRGWYDQACREVTNPHIKRLITTLDVGPFKASGLRPAVESLAAVMVDIQTEQPEVYAALGSAGMLCVRYVRNSTTTISNHSWGTAIDLTLNDILDDYGDGKVQFGLTQIAPIFNRHGWYWGASFPTEDGMHFEISDEKIRQWHKDGVFDNGVRNTPPPALSLGDRGPQVKELQTLLNDHGARLQVDGVFGRNTLAAVMDFQSQKGLTVDGIVGEKTWKALRA
jgi:hypothetical protein